MINRTKGIMVFIIFMTVLTFGTGVKNWNSQNETAPVNPVVIKSKNKSGKYENAEENGDKKKKHSLKNKKNIEKELKDLDVLLKELREYANEVKHIAEQKIVLDLDDGVNVNYEKLEAILKKR